MPDPQPFRLPHGVHIGNQWADGFPLRVMSDHAQPDTGFHTHDFTELVLVRHGQGIHVTAAGEHRIRAGDCFVIQPGDGHRYRATRELGIANVLFDVAALALPLGELRELPGWQALFAVEPSLRARPGMQARLRLGRSASAQALVLVAEIQATQQGRAPGWRFAARTRFMQLLLHLARAIARVDQRCDAAVLRLAGVLARLERDCTAPQRLADLAMAAGLGINAFLRVFKQATGTSPMAHLLQLRLVRAMEQLHDGRRSITAVALDCGFADPNYFTRQFTRLVGVSPSRWRSALVAVAESR